MTSEDWRDLFNGRDLDGWATTGEAEGWTVADGSILCTVNGGGYLYTVEEFGDFELSLEYRSDPDCNSGIFFHWSDLTDPVHTGLEIQILDTHGKPLNTHSCGALYDMVSPRSDAVKPAGEWNQVLLVCSGPSIELDFNGERILEVDIDRWETAGKNPDGSDSKFKYAWKTMPRRGHIGLQDHGGRIWFRNVRIRETG